MTSRRNFIKAGALAVASFYLTGCNSQFNWMLGHGYIEPLSDQLWAGTQQELKIAHILKRITYGIRPNDINRVIATGDKAITGFIETQLSPSTISDIQVDLLVRRLETLRMNTPDIFEITSKQAISELRKATIVRATYSERQLLELMVEFWSDHFNIYSEKATCGQLKVIDDREVIRPHALGRFRELLWATATSPAMLVYLDGQVSNSQKPNENYARELMELHTLGIDGGYCQQDVMELARALTGWKVENFFWKGRVKFDDRVHDKSEKILLGKKLKVNGNDLEQVVDCLSSHPSTARFISRKLCHRFIGEDISEELLSKASNTFLKTDGDISELLKVIFYSEEFIAARPKFKRPFTYTISALRALGASTDGGKAIQSSLEKMGQLPFNWPTPDGYPEQASRWNSQLLPRWNFAIELAKGRLKATTLDMEAISKLSTLALATGLLHRGIGQEEVEAIDRLRSSDPESSIALLLCLPEFQFS
ncbi:MAG: DUF1800 domain-containing protein [Blastocatellia bacterium]|nr:DUF1800 domain-containing protein [Blastocatellia bacterium]